MLAAIGFCPQPPLLVPEMAAGAAGELAGLRSACAEVVRRLLAVGPDRIVVLGPGPQTTGYAPGATGTLAGFGVSLTVALPGGTPEGRPTRYGSRFPALPLALTLGAWLVADSAVPCSAWAVGPDADPMEVGAGLDRTGRTALLVMGDGSACRSERAPGYVDPRAEAYDAGIAAALGAGDAATLRDLDPALGAELLAAGVPAWRAAGRAAADLPVTAELLHDAAPYGVGYFAATWLPRDRP